MNTIILVAVIDIKIAATTGADLNHLVRKILKRDFIMVIKLMDFQIQLHKQT